MHIETLVIATMHGKERAIGPVLERDLRCRCIVPRFFDTDCFGTFSGEIPRLDSAINTARKKCQAAFDLLGIPHVIASEGSFGPHPVFPLTNCESELLLYYNFDKNYEVCVHEIFTDIRFGSQKVCTLDELFRFAHQNFFPSHYLILESDFLGAGQTIKGIHDWEHLANEFEQMIDRHGQCHVSTDMRAMNNPTRMKNIAITAQKISERLKSFCPQCNQHGFGEVDIIRGRLCELCGAPTNVPTSILLQCTNCGFESPRPIPSDKLYADPGCCDFCNP
ncbi:MAG: DUF6671 family protein [Saprospiraceae bacterium]